MAGEMFLIDTNSFIDPYRRYYAFDLVPSYWQELSKRLNVGRVVLLDMVRNELNNSNDDLAKWIAAQTGFLICNHKTQDIIDKYQEVMQHVYDCGFYKPQAFNTWAQSTVADPWLIAAAAINGYTIITFEAPSGGLNILTPNRSAKIPDVASAFNVRVKDLYYMMRELGIQI